MRSQLFQAESNTFFVVIEIENYHVDFVVQFHHFVRMLDASPRKVGDVNQAVNAAQVNEYAVGSDVFNHTFEHLAFFESRNNFFFLLFQFFFDKSFVRNNHVFEFRIDFYYLEFHCFVNEDVVISDGFHVDLRTRQECFDAEHVNDHTAFGATFDVAFDYFVVFQRCVYAIPRARSASFFVRENKLSVFVFLAFDIDFYFVADFQFGVVLKLVC